MPVAPAGGGTGLSPLPEGEDGLLFGSGFAIAGAAAGAGVSRGAPVHRTARVARPGREKPYCQPPQGAVLQWYFKRLGADGLFFGVLIQTIIASRLADASLAQSGSNQVQCSRWPLRHRPMEIHVTGWLMPRGRDRCQKRA